MNKHNRSELARAIALLEQAKEIIEAQSAEEQEKFDNLSEGLQQSERGQQMEETAYELENIIEDIEASISAIECFV